MKNDGVNHVCNVVDGSLGCLACSRRVSPPPDPLVERFRSLGNRTAVYAGSFDPTTNGHIWMIRAAEQIFDGLHVAVAENPDKRNAFSISDRISMLKESLSLTDAPGEKVSVGSIGHTFLALYARELGARYLVRGVRNQADFAYEQAMRNVNEEIAPDLTTVFLVPPRELTDISSSVVKGMVGPQGWESVVSKMVSPSTLERLKTWRKNP